MDLRDVLAEGVLPAAELMGRLGVSSATMSRRIRRDPRVVRLGRTRAARYGLAAPVRDLPFDPPLYEIDVQGRAHPFGTLYTLVSDQFAHVRDDEAALFDGLPPFLVDMAPQGYLGARFARRHGDLDLPGHVRDWSSPHVVYALARRGEDTVGNLVLGEESLDRFLAAEPEASSISPERAEHAATAGAGSSAAGEQPKFGLFDGESHWIVKFTRTDSAAGRRWRDLLISEEHALATLTGAGVPAPRTAFSEEGDFAFLASERFDREGARGRRSVLSLFSIDAHRYGRLDSWARSCRRLAKDGLLPAEDAERASFLETFGEMIGNDDRHFGNLSLFCPERSAHAPYRLAPCYDMLPMALRPTAAHDAPDPELPRVPQTALNLGVHTAAADAASHFASRLRQDERLSAEYRLLWRGR